MSQTKALIVATIITVGIFLFAFGFVLAVKIVARGF